MEQMETKSKFDGWLERIGAIFLLVIIIYLPFYELVLHFLQSYTGLSDAVIFWLTHFYEPVMVLLIAAFLINFALKRKWSGLKKIDFYAIGLIILSLIMIAVYRNDLQAGLQGLRFLVLPYAIYLIARFSAYKNINKLMRIYLIIAVAMAAMAVVEYFFLPRGYMDIYYGLSGFGFGQNSLLTTTQATALLAGPNQLASYLILPFFYLLQRYFASDKNPLGTWNSYLLVLITLAIGLTYSRSALLGLIIAAIMAFIYYGRGKKDKVIYVVLFIVVAITLAISYALRNGELPRDLLTHGASMAEHQNATIESLKSFLHGGFFKVLFGFGVGSAGPIALKLGGIVSENYYLQICFELGLVGLAIYLLFIFGLLKKVYAGSKVLFFALVALLINALFLHIFSDNPAMAVSIFIIAGAIMNIETCKVETTQNL